MATVELTGENFDEVVSKGTVLVDFWEIGRAHV